MANHEQIMINEPASNLATKYLDTYGVTVGSTLLLREYTVIGGSTPTALADVIATDPLSNAPGVVVRDVNSSAVVARLGTTIFVQLDPGHLIGNVGISGTPTVTANAGSGTLTVAFDPGHTLGAITNTGFNVNNSPTVTANAGTGSFNVQFDPGHTLGKVDAGAGTFNVQFDPGHTLGSISNTGFSVTGQSATLNVALDPGHTLGIIDSVNKTVNVQFDPGHTLGIIDSITKTVAVYFDRGSPAVSATFSAASIEVIPTTGSRKTTDDASASQRVLIVGSQTNASLAISGTVTANAGTGTMNVQLDPGHTIGNIGTINSITGSVAVYFDRGNPSVNATFTATSLEVVPTTGSRKITDDASASQRVLIVGSQTNASLTINGTITGITNTIGVYLDSTKGTLIIKPDPAGTFFTNNASTAGIFTVSGSTSGVSVSGVNLVAPSAAYNFKVFAYSIQTTGIVSVVPKFVNGSGASQTEFWRPLATANQTASTPIGANMAVAPPGYLFATGTNTSLNLLLDTATLVHYSVSYIKESA